MSTPLIQANYEQLAAIAQRLQRQADESSSLYRRMQQGAEALRDGGWEGRGSAAFFQEIDTSVGPALQALGTALTAGDQTTRQLIAVMQAAEMLASGPFQAQATATGAVQLAQTMQNFSGLDPLITAQNIPGLGALMAEQMKKMAEKIQQAIIVQNLAAVTDTLGGTKNSAEHIDRVLDAAKEMGITNKDHLAYMMATAYHESKMGTTMSELGPKDYFEQYEGRLGNDQDGDGYKYRGRGYAQLTGKENYKKLSQVLQTEYGMSKDDADLVKHPERAAQPEYAAKIFAYGMQNGTYTGKPLSKYDLPNGGFDFYNARRIVNGMGTPEAKKIARDIAEYAKKYRAAL